MVGAVERRPWAHDVQATGMLKAHRVVAPLGAAGVPVWVVFFGGFRRRSRLASGR
jgi:hypothetical protein